MDDVLNAATKLGGALAGSDRFAALKAAEQAVEADETAQQLTTDLHAQSRKIADLEANLKPVEVADKREMQRIQQAVASNDALKQFAAAQADWAELMTKVNEAIQAELRS